MGTPNQPKSEAPPVPSSEFPLVPVIAGAAGGAILLLSAAGLIAWLISRRSKARNRGDRKRSVRGKGKVMFGPPSGPTDEVWPARGASAVNRALLKEARDIPRPLDDDAASDGIGSEGYESDDNLIRRRGEKPALWRGLTGFFHTTFYSPVEPPPPTDPPPPPPEAPRLPVSIVSSRADTVVTTALVEVGDLETARRTVHKANTLNRHFSYRAAIEADDEG